MITFFYFLKNHYYYELANILGNMNKFWNPKQFSKLQFIFLEVSYIFKNTETKIEMGTFSKIHKHFLKTPTFFIKTWQHLLKFTNILWKHQIFLQKHDNIFLNGNMCWKFIRFLENVYLLYTNIIFNCENFTKTGIFF